MIKIPQIGDVVMSPHAKLKDEQGENKHDAVICDGSVLNAVLYPLLSASLKNISSFDYTDTVFSMGDINSTFRSLVLVDIYIYVSDTYTKTISKYDLNGNYTDFSFTTATEDSEPRGIAWDSTHFWVCGWANNRVFQYTQEGVYTGVSFYIGNETDSVYGITWDGTHFWVGNNDLTSTVFQYDVNGTYTGFSFTTESITGPLSDMTYHDGHLWIPSYSENKVFKVTLTGIDTGIFIDMVAENVGARSLVINGNDFIILDTDTHSLYKYIGLNSLPNIAPKDARIPYRIIADLT